MSVIYGVFYFLYKCAAHLRAIVDTKTRDGIQGRKEQSARISSHYASVDAHRYRVLIHVASFGELEQAKPIIAELKNHYPEIHIHLTFFSPSGYLNAKDTYTAPDIISYLPFDDARSVRSFLDPAKPDLVIFVRYDLWPRFTLTLQERNIPAILISATYRSSVAKRLPIVGSLYLSLYHSLRHVFAVSEDVKDSLIDSGMSRDAITVSGDTRIDQVLRRKEISIQKERILPNAVTDKLHREKPPVFVVGSSWEEDEKVIVQSILAHEHLFTIIAPHEITEEHSASLENLCEGKAIRLSKIHTYTDERILIWDRIGDLFDLYGYADVAYVGGGFGAGVHNVLEPAVRAIPIIVGPHHRRSFEIGMMQASGGVFVISNAQEFTETFGTLLSEEDNRLDAGNKAYEYIEEHSGATQSIVEYLQTMIPHSVS